MPTASTGRRAAKPERRERPCAHGAWYSGHVTSPLDPSSFRFMKSIDIVVMVVLGGSGSVTGAIIAATVLTVLPEWLRFLAQYRLVIYSLLLIFMMLFRPEGLMGNRELFCVRRTRSRGKALAG